MRRLVMALAAAGVIAAAVYGAAATLGGINSATLGADDTAVASCDTDGVFTDYGTSYQPGPPPGYRVTEVLVGGINAPCAGEAIRVSLTQGGVLIGEGSSLVPTPVVGPVLVSVTPQPLAENVDDLHIVIG